MQAGNLSEVWAGGAAGLTHWRDTERNTIMSARRTMLIDAVERLAAGTSGATGGRANLGRNRSWWRIAYRVTDIPGGGSAAVIYATPAGFDINGADSVISRSSRSSSGVSL